MQLKSTGGRASRKVRAVLLASIVVWLSLVGAGLRVLWKYEITPGVAASTPNRWPRDSSIQPSAELPTLVMLAHPHCPCTRASIGQLASIMAHSQGRLKAYVLFVKPQGFSDEWGKTDLWRTAASIPGVTVILDTDGEQAKLFHAATSGQTVLYDREGRLTFSGGITDARGHFGDNAGQDAIVSLVNSETPDQSETAVFGCPLFNPESECRVPKDESKKH